MSEIECHGLDTPERVCYYEQDFYILSNFSSFQMTWNELTFPTSEHAYHWEKFNVAPEFRRGYHNQVQNLIRHAPSAHEAFKIGQDEIWQPWRRQDWNTVRVGIMRALLTAKVQQHEYVRRKLLATGDRELVENSWRDDFWGWGENGDGKNMLGKVWMEIRTELRTALQSNSDNIQEGGK
jgi:ribA/ribD-fused uncharacterized protein